MLGDEKRIESPFFEGHTQVDRADALGIEEREDNRDALLVPIGSMATDILYLS